jgi:transcriptional regulator with XRE-family HTH domain
MDEEHRRNAIGRLVQKRRSEKKLTQQDLAGRCSLLGLDIGRETVSQIERGSRGVSDLEMILLSKALRVKLDELVPAELPKWVKDLRPPNAVE